MRRHLRAVVAAAEDPRLRHASARRAARRTLAERMFLHQRRAGNPRQQVAHLRRKMVRRRRRVRVQRVGGQPVRPRRAAQPHVDPARRDRLQHAELFRHLQRRIMRQHDPGAAHAGFFPSSTAMRAQQHSAPPLRPPRNCGAPPASSGNSRAPRSAAQARELSRIDSAGVRPVTTVDWSSTASRIARPHRSRPACGGGEAGWQRPLQRPRPEHRAQHRVQHASRQKPHQRAVDPHVLQVRCRRAVLTSR